MGSTKFIVVQLRELIKNALFVALGVILIGLLIYFFIPKNKAQATLYIPGTYSSAVLLQNEPVSIDVTVSEYEITEIALNNIAETQEVFYPLVRPTLETLADEIIKTQSLEVNVSTDTQVTGDLLLKAVDSALEQARIE